MRSQCSPSLLHQALEAIHCHTTSHVFMMKLSPILEMLHTRASLLIHETRNQIICRWQLRCIETISKKQDRSSKPIMRDQQNDATWCNFAQMEKCTAWVWNRYNPYLCKMNIYKCLRAMMSQQCPLLTMPLLGCVIEGSMSNGDMSINSPTDYEMIVQWNSLVKSWFPSKFHELLIHLLEACIYNGIAILVAH